MSDRKGAAAGEPSAVVVNIQHFSTHDGPGIRTTVFLKGCSLACKWCCNPESLSPNPELAFNAKLCIGAADCGLCLPACAEGALTVTGGRIAVDRGRCTNCGRCAEVCPAKALHNFGRPMSVSAILAEVEQDAAFFAESGGGLTLSGGECLLEPDFAAALLGEARKRGFHTAIETAGNVPWEFMAKVLPHIDLMLHDYKLSDAALHKRWTGADNRRIRDNYRRAYEAFPEIEFVARIPLVPGVNDTEAHIRDVIAFIRPYPHVAGPELLPFHAFGANKYAMLGRAYALDYVAPPPPERLAQLRALIAAEGGPPAINAVQKA